MTYEKSKNVAAFTLMTNEKNYSNACTSPKSGGKNYVDIQATGGKVFYCENPIESNTDNVGIFFFYPITPNKSAVIAIRKSVWNQHYKEIYDILKTGTYKEK
jgi:hypothetical protein